MENNISSRLIVILVILTVVISLLGTWTVLNGINNINTVSPKNSDKGNVKLNILPNDDVQSQTTTAADQGTAVLNIEKSK
jgi:hypothetical protein